MARLACAVAGGLMLVSMWARTVSADSTPPGPAGDNFYTPPTPLPAGSPGTPIWLRPSEFSTDLLLGTPDDAVDAWQMLYRSTSVAGRPIAVSGTVLVPHGRDGGGPGPIVAYATGSVGLGDSCAISRALADGTYAEAATIKAILDAGFVVVATDYEGLGTPGDHPYIVNFALGRSVLDALRAALRIEELGLEAASPLGVWGYSEGGGAAAAAAELWSTYAPELNVVAVVAGGVPANLPRIAELADGQLGFAPVFLATIGYDAAYPELDLASYLNDQGRTTVALARDLCLALIGPFLVGGQMSEYTTTNPLLTPAYRDRLEMNRLGRHAPRMPIYLFHGELDEVIPIGVGRLLRDEYCAGGASVTWQESPGSEHFLTSTLVNPNALAWISDRFLATPLPSTSCPEPAADAGIASGTAGGPHTDSGASMISGVAQANGHASTTSGGAFSNGGSGTSHAGAVDRAPSAHAGTSGCTCSLARSAFDAGGRAWMIVAISLALAALTLRARPRVDRVASRG